MMDRLENIQLGYSQHRPSGKRYPLSLLAHDITDPANVGSLFRIADAMGIERIYLSGRSPTPPNKRLHRTSRTTDRAVSWEAANSPLDVITSLTSTGYTIIALEACVASHDIHDLCLETDNKVCLVLGNERRGVDQDILDACDTTIHIPMLGQNSSMNVAMATAIAAYEITRQLRPCS